MGLLKHTITCLICGKESRTDQTGKKYCSAACKQKAHRQGVTEELELLRQSRNKLRQSRNELRQSRNELRNTITEKENIIRHVESGGPIKVRDPRSEQLLTYQYYSTGRTSGWQLVDDDGKEVLRNMKTIAKGGPGHTEGCFCCGRRNYPDPFHRKIVNAKKGIRASICGNCNYHLTWAIATKKGTLIGSWEVVRLYEQGYTLEGDPLKYP